MSLSTHLSPPQTSGLLKRIRLCLILVIAELMLNGVIAFMPIREMKWILGILTRTLHFGAGTPIFEWLLYVRQALVSTSVTAPFLAFETDRNGLSRILLALLFLGPYRDPVRNRWVINFGLLSCASLVLFDFTAGPIRQIPVLWRCADASLALLCAFPLLLCRHYLHLLEHITSATRKHRSQKIRRLRHIRRNSGQ